MTDNNTTHIDIFAPLPPPTAPEDEQTITFKCDVDKLHIQFHAMIKSAPAEDNNSLDVKQEKWCWQWKHLIENNTQKDNAQEDDTQEDNAQENSNKDAEVEELSLKRSSCIDCMKKITPCILPDPDIKILNTASKTAELVLPKKTKKPIHDCLEENRKHCAISPTGLVCQNSKGKDKQKPTPPANPTPTPTVTTTSFSPKPNYKSKAAFQGQTSPNTQIERSIARGRLSKLNKPPSKSKQDDDDDDAEDAYMAGRVNGLHTFMSMFETVFGVLKKEVTEIDGYLSSGKCCIISKEEKELIAHHTIEGMASSKLVPTIADLTEIRYVKKELALRTTRVTFESHGQKKRHFKLSFWQTSC
ncbi:hypothetical protein BDR05DRAFT_953068 [Suillus weaverae]|nr:hypothetical protein BDR05DRAFT_953068 [Suillus weaverae]